MPDHLVRENTFHDDYVYAAEQLEHEAKTQLRPLTFRRVLSWIAAVIITVVMALLVFVVLESVFNFPPIIALCAAIGFQFVTIILCHAYFHGVYAGEGRWNWKFWVATVSSCIMLSLAYLRAHMYLEDMEMAPVVAAVISFIVSLIEPVISWVTGWMTAAAQDAWEPRYKIVERARQHGKAVRGAARKEATWQITINQAYQERTRISTIKSVDAEGIKRRDARTQMLDHWIGMLEQFDPNPSPLGHMPPQERIEPLRPNY